MFNQTDENGNVICVMCGVKLQADLNEIPEDEYCLCKRCGQAVEEGVELYHQEGVSKSVH